MRRRVYQVTTLIGLSVPEVFYSPIEAGLSAAELRKVRVADCTVVHGASPQEEVRSWDWTTCECMAAVNEARANGTRFILAYASVSQRDPECIQVRLQTTSSSTSSTETPVISKHGLTRTSYVRCLQVALGITLPHFTDHSNTPRCAPVARASTRSAHARASRTGMSCPRARRIAACWSTFGGVSRPSSRSWRRWSRCGRAASASASGTCTSCRMATGNGWRA